MLDIGGWEFLIVAFVLLMVVGPKELPKLLRGFTRAMRQVRSMASEFTRGMEDLATDSELGDLKNTIADVKTGNLAGIADKIDPGGELKESVAEVKSSADFDSTSDDLAGLKDVGDETRQQMALATKPAAGAKKSTKAISAKKKS
ncbi:Sec-independent protein translocase protein TatB [Alphaproteobacteria bacterium]|nr:Sec-independent protein translocase protein TatB [Alphaproteobacteria bacterium]